MMREEMPQVRNEGGGHWQEEEDGKKRGMKVVVSLEFPSWDCGGRHTGRGAQWRSMAS